MEYSKALILLDDYDYRTLKKVDGTIDDKKIAYEDCKNLIKKLSFNSDSDLFAMERNNGLEAIIASIYQTFNGENVHKSLEEKASNFLYMVVKIMCL